MKAAVDQIAPAPGAAAFPVRPGDVLGAWTVAAVELERRRARVRLQRGPDEVTLSVHPQATHPRGGPFDVGRARIYSESSPVPLAEFAAAGRELAARLAPFVSSDAASVLRAWARAARPQGVASDSFEAGPDLLFLDEVDEHFAASGREALVRGPVALLASASVLQRLAPHAARVRVEPAIVRARDGAPHLDEDAIRAALEAFAGAGLRVRLVFTPTPETVEWLPALAALARARGSESRGAPLVEVLSVVLPDVPDYERRGLTVPRLADVAAAVHAVDPSGTGRVRASSRLGEPLCLFPQALRRALLGGGEHGPSHVEGSFGAACESCALKPSCRGVSRAYAARSGTGELVPFVAPGGAPTWRDKARWLLVDRAGQSVTLGEILRADELPAWPCHLPWTRLELGDGAPVGPCCAEYQAPKGPPATLLDARALTQPIRYQAELPDELWNGPRLQAFRREMTGGGHPKTCRETCPVLVGGTYRPATLILWGGPAAAVESQIRLVEDMQAGAAVVRSPPQSLCVSTTSYCNYHCVMCDFGDRGSLADEKTEAFWNGLEPWLGALVQIDANGGEPLASPNFRAFLERTQFARHPQLTVCLTTNGSYLTPRQVDRFAHVPFDSITVSLNAATPEGYLAVNRGLAYERIREHLDALLAHRERRARMGLTYSMVILKRNLGEIRAFAELARRDGANVRFMLPMRNLNDQSIMLHRELMEEAHASLADVARGLDARGRDFEASLVRANLAVLEKRLRDGVLAPL